VTASSGRGETHRTPPPRVASLRTIDAFNAHLAELGVDLPVDAAVDPTGPLSQPITVRDASAGELVAPNRFAALPMEGWDASDDGCPTDLVRRRWGRIGASGCGLVWAEATAVRTDGRANPNQLVISEGAVDDFAALRALLAPDQVAGLQLTHSGRWCKPGAPRIAYRHPLLDTRVDASDASVFSDDELDDLARAYVDAAVLARRAGFDFVDIKHCHGYLLHELLSARTRAGRYGGDLRGRTRFLHTVTEGIRERAPDLAIAVRVSVFDLMPFVAGDDGTGVPATGEAYPYAFGGDGSGVGVDLTEAHAFLEVLEALGVGLVSTTAGSPYYNPHVQRPAFFPPSDGYRPPEDPLVGVARQISATAELAARHPELVIVGSGYSYLQEWLPNVAQGVIRSGGASMIGLGRSMLAYPELATDVLSGRGVRRGSMCRTFSDCTTAPRNGLVSGCYPLDRFYRERPERERLLELKDAVRTRLRERA
jgi:2,4-dienoyl-CoA reductase-like NADH-dependent reductase (Old Yellow Enzyme family)